MRLPDTRVPLRMLMFALALGLGDQGRNASFADPPAAPPGDVAKRNADRIRRVLPSGWTLRLRGSRIEVVRDEPVEWYSPSRVPDHLDHSDLKAKGFVQRSQFVMTLDFVSPTPHADVVRMEAENLKTRRTLDALNEEIDALQEKRSPFTEGWRDHAPRNAREQKLVAQYDAIKASLHRIPDFTMADASIFLWQSVGSVTLFYNSDVEEQCRHVRQRMEGEFVRQVDASRAEPQALMAKFADAIDSRDEKAMLACFGEDATDLHSPDRSSDRIWVLRMLAVLRLRDAMRARFGCEATEKALPESWLRAPDTERIRAARWSVKRGTTARIQSEDKQTLDWFYENGIVVGWDLFDRWGWRIGIGVPASGKTEHRDRALYERLTKIAEALLEEVKAGKHRTAAEVGERLRSMQRSAMAADNRDETLRQQQVPASQTRR